MSMMRLLAAGKSLGGLKNSGARYRMTDPRTLPKFGSVNNPFQSQSKAKPETAAAPVPSPQMVEKASGLPEQPSKRTKGADEPLPKPPAAPASDRSGKSTAPTGAAFVSTQGGLAKRFFKLFEPRVRAAKSGMPRLAKQPIQGELTLDNIRVVRNDLSDTDLEIVTAKNAPAPNPVKQASSVSAETRPAPAVGTEPMECRTEKKTGRKPVLQT